ncbi:23S rRNA (uracil(1939)-C(5))-methyltransferase RlmD [Lutispora sp.]|uniref:23S rRNA (uracil(1939)-C(5))-methyltransferase RlmD n=1 Tax=Lutispora sp. TaxID=2828727 RepID=UPI00356291FD
MEKRIPVEKNQDYIIDITSETSEGMGVGRIEGYTVFVDGALMGEKVKIRIVKILKNYSYGKLLEVIEPSVYRTQPQCPMIKRCGGCQIQHMSYEGQLHYKTRLVKEALERIGGLRDIKIHETIGMDEPWNYRNKAQFPVGMKDGKINIGFYAPRSHDIIDTNTCMIQDRINDEVLELIRNFIIKHDISIYDEKTGKGLIRHIMTRKGFKTGEVMICIVINGEEIPHEAQLVEELKQSIDNLKTVVLNINKKNTNVILGEKNRVIYGEGYIFDYIGEFKFKISPQSFFQVNPVQTEVLYNKALEYANLTGEETVIDAYCGIGTISLFLSKKARKVYGVEIVGQAIDDAKVNADINGIKNVEFIQGESEELIPKLYEEGIKADVVVVDPPRKGCDEKLLEVIVKMSPKRMVYVSCNPSTLARDLKYMNSNGYEVKEVQPVDQFPQTVHVESVVLMSRL